MIEILKHFVTFYSPGTLVAETSRYEIDSWDIDKAVEMSETVKERYDATPYGFRFSTYGRTKDELDSKQIDSSPMYYINCKVLTLAEIVAKNDPKDKILISNMRINGYEKVIQTTKGWLWTQPLEKDDIVL